MPTSGHCAASAKRAAASLTTLPASAAQYRVVDGIVAESVKRRRLEAPRPPNGGGIAWGPRRCKQARAMLFPCRGGIRTRP
eukprot:2847789-Pyramimonas_sp.AAC.1